VLILLSQSISGLVWGQIGDKFGYKIILSISSTLLFAEGLIALFAKDQWGFFVIAGIVGSVYSSIYISHPNIIFEISPPEDTSLFIGLSNTLIAPIISIAPILGGKIIDSLGHQNFFLTIVIMSITATIVSSSIFRESRGC